MAGRHRADVGHHSANSGRVLQVAGLRPSIVGDSMDGPAVRTAIVDIEAQSSGVDGTDAAYRELR